MPAGNWKPIDTDLDIFPTVERLMFERRRRGQGPPRSLEYFQDAIAEAFATRNREIPEGNRNGHRTIKTSGSVKQSPQEALFAAALAVDAELREKKLNQ
ncbi:hypothetical protein [Azospirillum agricola]|uniref:hypothetical protein n=1 Tax=Azospirillum agricola TaxID=1720247 RepID=UPI001177B6F7|nr:hypothetical protein [Azospirillum agricola]